MTLLLASLFLSEFQQFVARLSVCISFFSNPLNLITCEIILTRLHYQLFLALFCLVPVLFFITIDISLFLVKFFVQSSTDTYVTIKRQLSDPNLRKSFSFSSLSTISSFSSLAPSPTSKMCSTTISESPVPPSFLSLAPISRLSIRNSFISKQNHTAPNPTTDLWNQLRNYIFRDSIRFEKTTHTTPIPSTDDPIPKSTPSRHVFTSEDRLQHLTSENTPGPQASLENDEDTGCLWFQVAGTSIRTKD